MVTEPKLATLKKYGLTAEDFWRLWAEQNNVCFVCEKEPSTGRVCVDHDHVTDWKKMPPEQRKLYVRGILCWWCNKTYVGRAITPRKAQRVVEYLLLYQARRPVLKPKSKKEPKPA
jgi:hypothetical protein